MVTYSAQLPLPLSLPDRPKPMPALPQVAAAASSGGAMEAGAYADAGRDARRAAPQDNDRGPSSNGQGDTDAQETSGARALASQQTASLFAARLTMTQGLNFPPLDTREVGDQDIIDPQRPTARIPDPLLSIDEAKAGGETPVPAPEPIVNPEEARAVSVAPVPTPVELSAIAKAKGEAAETATSRAMEAETKAGAQSGSGPDAAAAAPPATSQEARPPSTPQSGPDLAQPRGPGAAE